MSLQDKLISKYGSPMKSEADKLKFELAHMCSYRYPADVVAAMPCLGLTIYCNKAFVAPYEKALRLLISKGLHKEVVENDQCYLPRYQRGSTTMLSIHTWGLAVDLNPTQNPIFSTREQCIAKKLKPFTVEFINAWRECGFTCGADFPGRPDLMHFEYTKLI